MKLHLPLLLLGSILSLPLTMTATADTVGSGVYYDVGKISYSSDENAKTPAESEIKTDKNYCWAAAASNVMQYWQDSYLNKADHPESTPNKFIQGFEQPYGTDYLSIYNEVLKSGKRDETGWPEDFFKWWFKGTPVQSYDTGGTWYDIVSAQDGYYNGLQFGEDEFGDEALAVVAYLPEIEYFTQYLQAAFETQGQAVALTIIGSDKETGEGALYHAISCWGYELDEQGLVSSLILSDSDDKYFGTFKVDVNPETLFFGEDYYMEDVPFFSTEDQGCYYKTMDIYVSRADYINTPDPDQKISAQSEIPTNGAVMENTRIGKAGQTVSGHGVTVGDDKTVVVLTSERGAELTLDGTEAPATDTGLKVTAGAMVSLVGGKDEQSGESVGSVIVNNYQNGGMELTGKAYFNDENVFDVSDNKKTGNGAGIATASYLEIRNNDTVTISGNAASGNGGGIYNTGSVSIRGNESVEFSGNEAAKGNDIYNAAGATVNIADNGNVQFTGSDSNEAAVVNDGELYLQSGVSTGEEGPEIGMIEFNDSALDSRGGKTYVGQDVNGKTANTFLSFSGGDDDLVIETADGVVTELDHLKVTATEIVGVAPGESFVKNATVATMNGLNLSELTLDTSSTFGEMYAYFGTSSSVNMDNVVITLTSADMTQTDYGYSVDLSKMFKYADMDLNTVYFDASSVLVDGLDEGKYINVNFGLGDDVKAKAEKVAVLFGNGMMTNEYTTRNGGNVEFRGMVVVPEPTTGTLSLLALAGLAARRRRK